MVTLKLKWGGEFIFFGKRWKLRNLINETCREPEAMKWHDTIKFSHTRTRLYKHCSFLKGQNIFSEDRTWSSSYVIKSIHFKIKTILIQFRSERRVISFIKVLLAKFIEPTRSFTSELFSLKHCKGLSINDDTKCR